MKPFLQNQIENAGRLIAGYLAENKDKTHLQPLSVFLKEHFRKHPEMGARDRKHFSSLVYNYFRTRNSLPECTEHERIAAGSFLCEKKAFPAAGALSEEILGIQQGNFELPLSEKINLIKSKFPVFDPHRLFPFNVEFSDGLKQEQFLLSFLQRPRVWIRARSGFEEKIKRELEEKNIPYETTDLLSNALSFDSSTSLEQLESKKKGWFEIQDLSSQLTGEKLNPLKGEKWWDCCAGSGGKSLMLLDKEPRIHLLATDVRPQIIWNFQQRMKTAGFKNYETAVFDVSGSGEVPGKDFDTIIADVPCSGSGTWARTPEMLALFNPGQIAEYSNRQKAIAVNASKALKKGGRLIYITCSVFKAENEGVVDFLIRNTGLELQQKSLLSHPEKGADSLFVAVLEKN